MNLEQRVQALEQEVEILKQQIQATLLEIQDHLLKQTYPMLRADSGAAAQHTGQPVVPAPEPPAVKRAASAPARSSANGTAHNVPSSDEDAEPSKINVRKVTIEELRGGAPENEEVPLTPAHIVDLENTRPTPLRLRTQQVEMPQVERVTEAPRKRKSTRDIQPPVQGVDWTTLADLERWVEDKLVNFGVPHTRELICMYAEQERFTRKIEKALLRFIDNYEERLTSVKSSTPARRTGEMPRARRTGEMPRVRRTSDLPRVQAAVYLPDPAPDAPPTQTQETRNVVLRLIAGVHNAGANVKWTKKDG